jgi:hypothetical protein
MKKVFCLMMLASMVSCTSLNSYQKSELKEWQAGDLEVQEKNPSTAAGLNVILGIGDFYNGNIGLGVVNLLTWPASILWAPIGGSTGAEEVNYYATKRQVDIFEKNKKTTQSNVEEAFLLKKITEQERAIAINKISAMQLRDFKTPVDVSTLIPARATASK